MDELLDGYVPEETEARARCRELVAQINDCDEGRTLMLVDQLGEGEALHTQHYLFFKRRVNAVVSPYMDWVDGIYGVAFSQDHDAPYPSLSLVTNIDGHSLLKPQLLDGEGAIIRHLTSTENWERGARIQEIWADVKNTIDFLINCRTGDERKFSEFKTGKD